LAGNDLAVPILPDQPPQRKRKTLIPSHGGALPVPLSETAYSVRHRRVVPMAEQIGDVAARLSNDISRPKPQKQPSMSCWRDLDRELKACRTPEEKEAIWERFEKEQTAAKQTRRQRRGSTLDPVKFRPIDRNERAKITYCAEKLDAKTHEPGKHGGCLKRSGLHVLRILLFHFHNVHNGRCDPSIDTIAKACGMARSTVIEALKRLEAAGIIERIRRARWINQYGRKRCVQWSNAYLLNMPYGYRKTENHSANSANSSKSGNRSETTTADRKTMPPMPENVAAALARLGNAMAARAEAENERMKYS
jgi:DNA-binding Lrp family transcriptional regulator